MNEKLFNQLLLAPEAFNFYQFCRLLEKNKINLQVPDLDSDNNQSLQFCAWPYLGFPASELKKALPENIYDYKLPIVFTTFMGLIGTDGVMPNWLIAEAAQKKAGMEHLTAFLDMFHHRLILLLYQVWKRFYYEYQYQENIQDNISQALLTLIHGQSKIEIDARAYLGVIRQLNKKNKNVFGLVDIVHYVLPSVKNVEIKQFIPVKRAVPQLSLANGIPCGQAVLGRFLYDANSRIRIYISVSDYQTLGTLYKGQNIRNILENLIKKYIGFALDVELVVNIAANLLPIAKLNSFTPQLLGTGVKVGNSNDNSQFAIFLGEL